VEAFATAAYFGKGDLVSFAASTQLPCIAQGTRLVILQQLLQHATCTFARHLVCLVDTPPLHTGTDTGRPYSCPHPLDTSQQTDVHSCNSLPPAVLQFEAVALWVWASRPGGLCLDLGAIQLWQWLAFLLLFSFGQALNTGVYKAIGTTGGCRAGSKTVA
jgi:hypothetical protein